MTTLIDEAALPIPGELAKNCAKSEMRSEWLARLPSVVADLSRRWALAPGAPFDSEVSCAWVAPCTRADGSAAVLKVQMPHDECRDEAPGLRAWDGNGTVRLLASDDSLGALLLERCQPGRHLRELPEMDQDVVLAGLLRGLWIEPGPSHPFRTLAQMIEEWSHESANCDDPGMDAALRDEGLATYRKLLSEPAPEVLLATDLHAGNVLSAEREPWLVIDPKPYVGDPAYDATQHLLNCRERLADDPRGTIERYSELLGLDAERVRRWTFARLASETGGDVARKRMLANRVAGRS